MKVNFHDLGAVASSSVNFNLKLAQCCRHDNSRSCDNSASDLRFPRHCARYKLDDDDDDDVMVIIIINITIALLESGLVNQRQKKFN